MIKKGSFLYSIFYFKCPSCCEGDFFISHPYNLSRIGDLYKQCSSCKTKFSKEPGFYYGAMYVSYAFAVALSFLVYVIFELVVVSYEIKTFIIAYSILVVFLSPYLYALSKIFWANLFLKSKSNNYK